MDAYEQTEDAPATTARPGFDCQLASVEECGEHAIDIAEALWFRTIGELRERRRDNRDVAETQVAGP